MNADKRAFTAGYITAVTNLLLLHDQPGMARDLIEQHGKIDWRTIDRYDRHVLREAGVFRDLHNRRRIKRASRRS